MGAVWGIELRDPDGSPAAAMADRTLYAALTRGLSFKVGGENVICLCPPLTISAAELAEAASILDAALASAASAYS